MKQSPRPLPSPWLGHALVATSALQAAGIPAQIADYHTLHVYPHLEFGYCRARILIPPACNETAQAVLSAAQMTDFEPLYPCPNCAGETRRRKRILSMVAITIMGSFFPFYRRARRCGSCHLNIDAPPRGAFTAEELGYDPDPRWPDLWAKLTEVGAWLRRRRYE
ncbi:hypothetical protein [Maricaulis sp.]|uniref:hypothetical protein n=1 Tax=Maricaulis sp. TaxID=1486257 RepID=UPI003A95D6FC